MYKKPIQSLKEDFQTLGLIRDNAGEQASGQDLSEAKVIKKKTGSGAKRAAKKRKIEYLKHKSQRKRAAAKYRKSGKGKMVIKKHEKIVSRMGGTKPGKIIRTSSIERNANLIEEMGKLNHAMLNENKIIKQSVSKAMFTEAEVGELRRSIKNTHRLASILAKRLAEYIERHGHKIPKSLLKKHFTEAPINPYSSQWENPKIDPDKPLSKPTVGQEQPTDVGDEHDVDKPEKEAKKDVQQQ